MGILVSVSGEPDIFACLIPTCAHKQIDRPKFFPSVSCIGMQTQKKDMQHKIGKFIIALYGTFLLSFSILQRGGKDHPLHFLTNGLLLDAQDGMESL